ncbi:glycosyltransferase [Nesterenkonia salmonea]|uniref:Glycosyltransferase n=1 Tax=Nesterenkonia salmonea TaxID=1804987 RepID=A0A5R9BAM2_9MICC|nr:glycosyltransferase [Nesterenkonia salmonea]TLP97035.1 glycosyltransferase [Nesterenkonia salmonea]
MIYDASVIIPAYNAEETLTEQLEAPASQETTVRFEVLVCDNGSSDSTPEVTAAFSPQFGGLRLIDASSRRGASAARNIGAAAARSPHLLFCDADDVVSAGWVSAMHHALLEAPFAVGAVEHSLLNRGRDWDFGWNEPTFYNEALPQLPAGGSGNMGIHAEVFAEVGGFEESLSAGEDLDFSWRVQLAGYNLLGVPEAIVHVRKRDGLLASLRQAYAKGSGTRLLSQRYSRVREAYAHAPLGPSLPETVGGAEPAPSRRRRIQRKVMRIARRPSEVIPHAAALAHRLGYSRAQTGAVAQLTPPETLP